jgi:hypothetical protein
MAAFVLFVVAVAGAAVVADLVGENPTVGQVTVFSQTVGYPEGWMLVIAAGLGFVVALLLVASVNSTKRRRARRKQLRPLRHGSEDQVAASEPDHTHLLDAFFGPEVTSRHPDGPARPVELESEGRERRVEAHQPVVTPQPIQQLTEPLYQQARSDMSGRKAGRTERKTIGAGSQANWSTILPNRSTSRPNGPLAWARTGTCRSRPARDAGGSGARRGSRWQGAAGHTLSPASVTGLAAPD